MKKLSLIAAALGLALASTAYANKPTLTVYTYDSFASEWGPGVKLEQNFEKTCQCDVKFVPLEDGVTMFNRVRLEGNKTQADVVLGLDNFTVQEAEKSGLFVKNNLEIKGLALPQAWDSSTFLPYDFGEYAFVYKKTKLQSPPKSLKELVERQDLKVIYQDPRTSTVGRGLLVWINSVFKDNPTSAWQNLAKHTVTIGKGWSETYGAFLKGESDLVLSYTTSPLYHQWHEKDENFVAASFSEGHLAQIEVAAITKASKQPELAKQFLAFLHQPESQKIISFNNVMKPVLETDVDPAFKTLPAYPALKIEQPTAETIKQWIDVWQKAVSK